MIKSQFNCCRFLERISYKNQKTSYHNLLETHNEQVLSTDFRRTVNFGIKTIIYRAPSLWAKLPSEYKLEASLEEFKVKIKK